ncbi:MAG: HAD family phosphatase [Bacteroidetes bacterium]|nr:HAD family phosphatase [Bacteroidota bacterium]
MSVSTLYGRISVPSDCQGLIFDCDGTLVDSMPLHTAAWKHVLSLSGVPYDDEFFLLRKGMKETELIDEYNNHFGTALKSVEIVRLKHLYVLNHIHMITPINAVVAIAKEYRSKLPMAVASGGVREIVEKELMILGILSWFRVIVTADDSVKPKPAPDIFLEAARRMNVQPHQCLVFEDGDLGLAAAERAGMRWVDVRKYI